jgi:DNA primase
VTITPAFLDEIRARTALAAVVGRRVKLTRAGHEWKGCCPFHNEKTPSFYVNEDKGFYHCFGCGAHGDVIRFMTEQEGLSFPDAVRQLAEAAGLEMPTESPEARARAAASVGLHEVMAKAAAWFTEQLGSVEGASARAYLQKRGIDSETMRAFGLGLAPDSKSRLKSALGDIGIAKLIDTGLLIQPEAATASPSGGSQSGTPREAYDRFRARLMFPIRDPRGRVIAFGGRIMGDSAKASGAKYLNSPDTLLFDKGRTLYNFERAGPLARKSTRMIVVEGYMDVIALAQAGFAEAVAPLGTALTEHQLALLWRVVPEPILCFDGDAAGQRAGLRAALRALPLLAPGRSLRFATLPPGQDPDDVVRNKGAPAFDALLTSAEPLIELLWRSETQGVDTATPERRAALRERLRAHSSSIADASVRSLYDSEFRARFDASFSPRRVFAGGGGAGVSGRQAARSGRASPGLKAINARKSGDSELAALLVGLLEHPGLADLHGEALAGLEASEPQLMALRAAILDAAIIAPDLDKAALAHTLASSGLTPLCEEVRRSNRLSFSFTRADTELAVASDHFGHVVGNLMARRRIDEELAQVTTRFRLSMSDDDYAAQQRLLAERQRANTLLMQLAARQRDAGTEE